MSIQDRVRLIAQYLKAKNDPQLRKLIRATAEVVDAMTVSGPRLVDELDGLDTPAVAA
ncbi:hypothetical protein [Streptomyces chilikensis]|uniref:Uncharacterized protein n=1 Tax=Streptomyces chilikensis TaxID=1194079 RepID=A0ABV3EXX3_9ACTN